MEQSSREPGLNKCYSVLNVAVGCNYFNLFELFCLNIQIGECIGIWWKPDFESLLYPYLPPNIKRPKVILLFSLLFYFLAAAISS